MMMMNSEKDGVVKKVWPVGRRLSVQCDKYQKSTCPDPSKMLEIFMAKPLILAGVIGFISLLLTTAGFLPNPSPIVSTENGPVQGRLDYSRSGSKYFSFLGIPFAKPPVGPLRFEPPEPLDNFQWKDVRQATSYPPYCLQFDALVRGRVSGQEDCLYLNVFTSEIDKKKPVIIYIHGGGFLSGSTQMYQPDYFMDFSKDIVLVTINYRLGPLGFLSTLNLNNGDGYQITGNMGMKDQKLAILWVKKNIVNFGGNPEQITLMGESAGAASVHLHSIISRGLFQRAIIQSGAITCPWSFSENPRDMTLPYLQKLDCPIDNATDLVHCLKTMDPVKLVKLQTNLMNPVNDFLLFVPTVEPKTAKDAFLTENPRKLLKAGKIASKIPVLFGVTSGEGGLRTARFDAMPEALTEIDKKWAAIAPTLLVYNNKNEMYDAVADRVRSYYFGNKSFTEDIDAFKKNFTKMASDAMFYEPVRRAARFHVQNGQPVYMYFYDYNSVLLPSSYSLFRSVRPDDWLFAEAHIAMSILVDLAKENICGSRDHHEFGSTHADDLFQLWNMEGLTGLVAWPDADFSNKFVKSFVDFAMNVEPLQFNNVTWPPAKSSFEKNDGSETPELEYMLLGNEPKMIREPFADRMPFWESLNIRNSKK